MTYHNPGQFVSRDDDPRCHAFDSAVEAIDCDPDKLHQCAYRVIRSGMFDDLLMDQIKPSAMAEQAREFVVAVRREVEERASANIHEAREFNREALEDR